MKDKKSFAFVYEFLPSVRCAVIVAGWGLWSFETKELAEHCARDINQAQADGIKEAVAERDARIAELEKALRLSVKELVAWSEKINPFGWHFCCDSNVDGPENHNAECGVYSAIQEAVAVLGKGER